MTLEQAKKFCCSIRFPLKNRNFPAKPNTIITIFCIRTPKVTPLEA